MATLVVTSNLDLIEDGETLVTYDGALGNLQIQLPTVVTGGAGANVDDGVAFEFQNDGDARLEILDEKFRRVFDMQPWSSLVLRSKAELDGTPRWYVSDLVKEIIAVAEAADITDLAVTDVTTQVSASAYSGGGTYTQATVEADFDTAFDAVIDNFESEFATAFAQVETTLNAVLAALTGANITA